MADILEKIIAHKRVEVEHLKMGLPQEKLEEKVKEYARSIIPSMSQELLLSETGIIAEFKRKSPSKGWINKNASERVVPINYQYNGATALSILTDSYFFGGSNNYLITARRKGVTLPILYKNFIIDEYQIYQARLYGASAILLIAACLTLDECRHLIEKAHELKMEVLLEMHSAEEMSYAELGPDMCGINNRHLGTFETDVKTSFELAGMLPPQIVRVSESGISDPATVKQLRDIGFRGFLIGETFMKEPDPGLALSNFIAQLKALG